MPRIKIKKDDIEDAQIIDEQLTPNQSSQEKPKDEKQNTIEIDMSSKTIDEKETVKVDLAGSNTIKDFIQMDTKKSEKTESEPEKSIFNEKDTIEDIKQNIDKEVSDMTLSDYEAIAEIIVDILDTLMSSALRYIASDNSDAPYSLSVSKKRMIKKSVSLILIKYSKKMGVWAMLIMSLSAAYTFPVSKAFARRKTINKIKRLRDDKKIAEAEMLELELKRK